MREAERRRGVEEDVDCLPPTTMAQTSNDFEVQQEITRLTGTQLLTQIKRS